MIRFNLIQSTILFFGLFFLFSCNFEDNFVERVKTNSEGIIIGKEPIWIHNSGNGKLIWPGVGAAVYDNHVVVAGNSGENEDILLALDIDTGIEKWRWDEFMREWPVASFNNGENKINQKDNLIIISDGRDYICIDIDKGKTVWNDVRKSSDNTKGIKIHGDKYYYGFNSWNGNLYIPMIVEGDIYSSNWKPILIPKIDTIQNFQNAYGTIGEVLLYEEGGDLIIGFGFVEFLDVFNNNSTLNYFSLFNYTKRKFIIEKLKLGEISNIHVTGRPLLIDDIIIVNSDFTLYGIHNLTGEIVWTKDDFERSRGDGRFILDNYQNELIAVNQTGPFGRVMKINPKNGNTIWERFEEGGHAENIHFYRDILYFVDRGTGILNAFDLNTGKRLWKMQSPDREIFSHLGGFLIIPSENEKPGKLIASTFLNTYCFTTER